MAICFHRREAFRLPVLLGVGKCRTVWPSFDWADPLLLEASLREDEKLVQASARGFAQGRLMPLVRDMHRHEKFDPALLREMGSLGLLGSTIPEFGGISPVAYGLIARELEKVDSAFRSSLSVQSSLVMHPIHAFGSEAQKEKYLPKLARGEWIGAFGLTEPGAGSDPGAMQARARKTADGYVLSGIKTWITHAPVADVFVVWAKLEDRIHGFILERGDKGLSTPKIEGKFSLRASATGEIAMEDVAIPEDRLLPDARRAESAFRLSQSCALRHRLGRDGGGGILLACGANLWPGTAAVRPAACRQPALSEEAGRHADRDHPGPHRLPAGRPADGRGQAGGRSDQPSQAQQCRQGAGDRARKRATCMAATAWPTTIMWCAIC